LIASQSEKLSIVWIDHLPNVLVPTNLAQTCSCSAIEIISPAEAVIPSTNTTIGTFSRSPYHLELKTSSSNFLYLAVTNNLSFGTK